MKIRSYLHDLKVVCQNHWWIPWIAFPTLLFTLGVYVFAEPLFGKSFAAAMGIMYLGLGILFLVFVLLVRLVWRALTPDDPDPMTD